MENLEKIKKINQEKSEEKETEKESEKTPEENELIKEKIKEIDDILTGSPLYKDLTPEERLALIKDLINRYFLNKEKKE